MTKDPIHMFYHAGNGGYYALWLMLLGTDYRCSWKNFPLDSGYDLNQLFDLHWNKKDHQSWAYHEILNDNINTKKSKYPNKVYLSCNPTAEQWNNSFGKRVVIYTDILTQTLLSIEKQTAISIFVNDYNKEKILQVAEEMSALYPTIEWQGKPISSMHNARIKINDADIAIDLRDLIKTKGKILLEYFGYELNQKCIDFTDFYLKLHSDHAVERLVKND